MFILEQSMSFKITQSPDLPPSNNITLIAGKTEMLRVADDGFYVRGEKVPADDKEAERVYNAFKQFLTWAEMNRR
jgi:hypothetical protein